MEIWLAVNIKHGLNFAWALRWLESDFHILLIWMFEFYFIMVSSVVSHKLLNQVVIVRDEKACTYIIRLIFAY